MTIRMNGKKISRKTATEMIGEKKLKERIQEARETHAEDPWTLISWMDGMSIEFED